MGRKPLFGQAMFAAERQRRRRAKAGNEPAPVTEPKTVTDGDGFYDQPLFFNPKVFIEPDTVTNDEAVIYDGGAGCPQRQPARDDRGVYEGIAKERRP